ncbi:amidophosphoribosyltransferase [Lacunimicrobium album]
MAELHHECGVAAIYHFTDRASNKAGFHPLLPVNQDPEDLYPEGAALLMPQVLQDMQNRGQLAAGMTSFHRHRNQLIDTHKDVGSVAEVFLMNHLDRSRRLMADYKGHAAIGHVRYATCGPEDKSYAQPFERHHIQKSKWFSFAFNGQLANYEELKQEMLEQPDFHLARETDTEVIMHLISQDISKHGTDDYVGMMNRLSKKLDGAYNIVFLNALGDMFVARDPIGIRPLCYAVDGPMFVAASESVAISNLGIHEDHIRHLAPGEMIIIKDGKLKVERYTQSPRTAHCFFEWIYFANVASTLDDRSVYLARKRLGEELAAQETLDPNDPDVMVVPVPDTAKAAASSMAYEMKLPCLEGLIRNRYVGRTFIEGANRKVRARAKYTALPHVLKGKKVILVDDTIVRSTTMGELIRKVREQGEAKEVHVRIACPPIIAPCYYGIDIKEVGELFAPRYLGSELHLTREMEEAMAREIGADSLRYLPVDAISRAIDIEEKQLCRACLTGEYPTETGQRLYDLNLTEYLSGKDIGRHKPHAVAAGAL